MLSNDSEFHLLSLAGATAASCSGMTSTTFESHLMLLVGATTLASCSSMLSNDSEFHLLSLAGATGASCSGMALTTSESHLLLLAGTATLASCSSMLSNDSEFHLLSLGGASGSPLCCCCCGGLSSSTSAILGSLSTLLRRLRGSRGCSVRPRSTKVSTGMVLTSVVVVVEVVLRCGSTSQDRSWRSGRRARYSSASS